MTSSELVRSGEDADLTFAGLKNDELIARMDESVVGLDSLSDEELVSTLTNASVVEAAAHQAKASAVEVSAARLRLHAERRLGELSRDHYIAGFQARELRDFQRLADIPSRFKRVFPANKKLGFKREVEIVDLFEEAVEYQLFSRSHTAHAVWMRSLDYSSMPSSRSGYLYRLWDGSWQVHYKDAVTGRHRQVRVEGTEDHALEVRNVLRLKIRPEGESPLSIKRSGEIGVALDHVRAARKILGETWGELSDVQKRALDGAYGRLDDLATAIVQAVDLAP